MAKTGAGSGGLAAIFDRLRIAHHLFRLDPAAPRGKLGIGGSVDRLVEIRPASDADQRRVRQGQAIADQERCVPDHRLQPIMPVLDGATAEVA